MGEKQEIIKKMLELQKKFREYDKQQGLSPREFYAPPEGHELANYREEYRQLATKLVDIAHEEKGSHR